MEFRDAVSARRSEYMLDSQGVDVDAVVSVLRGIAGKVPSSFNAQSARMFVLAGEDHRRFWGIVEDVLTERSRDPERFRGIVEDVLTERSRDPERFRGTQAKLAGFSVAAGTILFYEVDAKTEELMEEHPSYRDLFPQWAEHGNAMMQFAFWTAIADMGLGANIQHYNPIVDARVAEEFGIPDGYRLIAQMVFGRVVTPAGPKDKLTGEDLVAVARVNNNKPKDM